MTTPEAIARIRAFCQHLLDLDAKAAPPPWSYADEPEGPAAGLVAVNRKLITTYREYTPGMVRMLMSWMDNLNPGEVVGGDLIAFAKSLPEVGNGR